MEEPSFRERYVDAVEIGENAESLDEAIRDGYQRLVDRDKRPPFRVVEILADGTNPFSGYKVVMRSDA